MRWVFLLLMAATLLAGCSKYETTRRPELEFDLFHSATSAAKLPQKGVLSHDRFLLIRVGDTTARLTLFGRDGVSAQSLAQELDQVVEANAGFGHPEVSKDDTPMAVSAMRTSALRRPWVVHLDLGSILSQLHLKPDQVLVRVFEGGSVDTKGLKRIGSADRHSLFLVERDAPDVAITREYRPSTSDLSVALLFLLGLAFLPLVLPAIAGAIARVAGSRFWLYASVAYLSPVVNVGLMFALFSVAGEGNSSRIFVAWFGEKTNPVDALVPIMLGSFVVPLIAETWFLVRPPILRGIRRLSWRLSPASPLLAGYVGSSIVVAVAASGRPHQPDSFAPMLGIIAGGCFIGLRGRLDSGLTQRAADLAVRMGTAIPHVMVGSSSGSMLNALALPGNEIFVTGACLKRLAEAEMDFLLAHELAHFKLHGSRFRLRPTRRTSIVLATVGAIAPVTTRLLDEYWLVAIGLVVVIVIAAAISKSKRRGSTPHEREFEADAEALRTTLNYSAALSLLRKLKHPSKRWQGGATHPSLEAREERLHAAAIDLGLSLEPPLHDGIDLAQVN